jgi:hypothetical protein
MMMMRAELDRVLEMIDDEAAMISSHQYYIGTRHLSYPGHA